MSEPLITFDDGQDGGSPDPTSAAPDPSSTPTAPSPEVLAERLAGLEAEKTQLEQRLHDKTSHADRLYQENQAANDLLRQAYKPKQTVEDLTSKIQRPVQPTPDQVIQNPHLAIQYADAMSRYTAEFVSARSTPIAAAAVQMAPIVQELAEFRKQAAIDDARGQLDTADQQAFDEALPKIEKTIAGAQWGAKLALSPRAWLTAYAGLGGARPVRTPSTPPPTVPTNTSPSHTSADPSDPSSAPPAYFVEWAKKAGRDPKEMWKRQQARRRPR